MNTDGRRMSFVVFACRPLALFALKGFGGWDCRSVLQEETRGAEGGDGIFNHGLHGLHGWAENFFVVFACRLLASFALNGLAGWVNRSVLQEETGGTEGGGFGVLNTKAAK